MNRELALQRSGILCVVSGPSGSGKTTLCKALSSQDPSSVYAVSATTRPPRPGERDGKDYYFLGREEFELRCTKGDFLEFAEVYGHLYGTLKSEVIGHILEGRDVLMDLDVQGAQIVKHCEDPVIQDAAVDIFILPPNEEELIRRLNHRATESPEQRELRLRHARDEMGHWSDYTYCIVSGTKEDDFAAFQSIIQGERCRSRRLCGNIGDPDRQVELEL